MIVELVGGPHCGLAVQVTRMPSVVMQVHSLADGSTWEAFYVPDGTVTKRSRSQRYCYTEQRRMLSPALPPPAIPGE